MNKAEELRAKTNAANAAKAAEKEKIRREVAAKFFKELEKAADLGCGLYVVSRALKERYHAVEGILDLLREEGLKVTITANGSIVISW